MQIIYTKRTLKIHRRGTAASCREHSENRMKILRTLCASVVKILVFYPESPAPLPHFRAEGGIAVLGLREKVKYDVTVYAPASEGNTGRTSS